MKTLANDRIPDQGRNPTRQRALTIVETLITMSIFSLVVLALVYAHLIGLRQDQLVESKLGASDMARRDFEQLANDVRGSQVHFIGTYSGSAPSGTFTQCANNTAQQANAVQLFLNATNNSSILYYFDTNSTPGNNTLRRYHTGDASYTVIATSLTNYYGGPLLFVGENFDGSVQTDPLLNKSVIHFTLGFLQYEYPLTKIGNSSNYLYDFYKMEFRLSPHVPSGR